VQDSGCRVQGSGFIVQDSGFGVDLDAGGAHRFDLTQSVFKVVLQKSIPTQIRQIIIFNCNR
jgi:hypothetical protein